MKYLKIFVITTLTVILSCSTTPKTEEGYIDTGSTTLYYKTIGQGEPLIVLHGGPGLVDHQILLPYIGELGNEFKIVLYDQRGCGKSIGSVDSTTINIDTAIEDIEAVRKLLNLDKINLAGASWGGMLAMFYGIKYPEHLKSLILISTTASSEFDNEIDESYKQKTITEDLEFLELIEQTEAFKNKDPKSYEKYFRILFKNRFANPSFISNLNLVINNYTAEFAEKVNMLMYKSIGVEFNLHDKLARINCPTLIMHGRHDGLPVEAAEKMHKFIQTSDLVIFENSGHFPGIEETPLFIDTIKNFLNSNN